MREQKKRVEGRKQLEEMDVRVRGTDKFAAGPSPQSSGTFQGSGIKRRPGYIPSTVKFREQET